MIQEGGPMGFTIIEVMVFLAISALLFVGAMTAIGGRQNQVQFQQGVRDAQSKLEDVINQVVSGFYPNPGTLPCRILAPSNVNSGPDFSGPGVTQGANGDCIFLGKVMQFTDNTGSGSGTLGAVNYNLLSVAGRRVNKQGQDVTSLKEALPTAIAGLSGGPDVTEKNVLQFGVKVTRIMVPTSAPSGGVYAVSANDNHYYDSIAFFSSLAKLDANTGTLASGAQHVSFGVVQPEVANLNRTQSDAANAINKITDESGDPGGRNTITMNPPNGIIICLADQTNKQKAMLTIGGGTSQTSVNLSQDNAYSENVCP